MALEINEHCVNCFACLDVCPNDAIEVLADSLCQFSILEDKCTECLGDFAEPQCAAICPIEGAIVNELGDALNPPGSLTGIPPSEWDRVMNEIAAR